MRKTKAEFAKLTGIILAGLSPHAAIAQASDFLDIPEQELASAITELGEETGLQNHCVHRSGRWLDEHGCLG